MWTSSAALAVGLMVATLAAPPKLPWTTVEQVAKDAEDKMLVVCPPSTPITLVPLKSASSVYAMWVSNISRWLIGEFKDETSGERPRWVWYGEFHGNQLVVKAGPVPFDPNIHTARWLCGWLNGEAES